MQLEWRGPFRWTTYTRLDQSRALDSLVTSQVGLRFLSLAQMVESWAQLHKEEFHSPILSQDTAFQFPSLPMDG